MKIVLKKNNTTLLHAVFIVWLSCEILLQNTTFSRLALMAFVGISILVSRRFCWSAQLTGYGLMILWGMLNVFMGKAVSSSTAQGMIQTLLLNMLFLYAFISYCRYVADMRMILKIFLVISTLFCIPLLIGGGSSVFLGQRLAIMKINANRIAKLLAYAAVIATYSFLEKPKECRKAWDIALIVFLLGTMLLTGSRKGLIIPAVGVYVLLCMRRPGKFVRYSVIMLLAAAVLLYLLLNVDFLYEIIGYRVEPVLQYLQQKEYSESSLFSRLHFIELGWELGQKRPIWGHGLDCFRLLAWAGGTYSHCNFIEIFYSLGWVGLLLYYFPFLRTFFVMFKLRNRKGTLLPVMASLLIPFVICDYMNVTYFDRLSLLIPAMAIFYTSKRGGVYETEEIA